MVLYMQWNQPTPQVFINNVAIKILFRIYRKSSHLRVPTEHPEPQLLGGIFSSRALGHFLQLSWEAVKLAGKQQAVCPQEDVLPHAPTLLLPLSHPGHPGPQQPLYS